MKSKLLQATLGIALMSPAVFVIIHVFPPALVVLVGIVLSALFISGLALFLDILQ
jgi:hypothetical protein